MPTIQTAYGPEVTMVATALQSLAASGTVGWQSALVDNTADLYLDALVQVVLDFTNVAPANDKGASVFAYGGLETAYTSPATGTEGTITLPAMGSFHVNLKLIGMVAYNTANEVVESQPFAVGPAFGGVLPPKWGIVIMNYSGAALAASGNSVKWRGVYTAYV